MGSSLLKFCHKNVDEIDPSSQGTEYESQDVSVYKAVLDYLNKTDRIALQTSPLKMKRDYDRTAQMVINVAQVEVTNYSNHFIELILTL